MYEWELISRKYLPAGEKYTDWLKGVGVNKIRVKCKWQLAHI